MFIETEVTPNPETLKFLPGRAVMEAGSASFADDSEADYSPLAKALFAIGGVKAVFLGGDFVSITKEEAKDWPDLKPEVLSGLMQFFMTSQPVVNADYAERPVVEEDDADAEIVDQIKSILEEKVRPAVANDGGDIVYKGFQEGIVYLEMQGACAGCPSSTITLKHGIENLLKYYVPEVAEVRAV